MSQGTSPNPTLHAECQAGRDRVPRTNLREEPVALWRPLVVEIRLAAPGECPASYVARTFISGDGVAVPIFAGLGGNHTHFRAVYSVC